MKISVQLTQHGVYFAGEKASFRIVVTNNLKEPKDVYSSNSNPNVNMNLNSNASAGANTHVSQNRANSDVGGKNGNRSKSEETLGNGGGASGNASPTAILNNESNAEENKELKGKHSDEPLLGYAQLVGLAFVDPMFVKKEALTSLSLKPLHENNPKETYYSDSTISYDQDQEKLFFATPVALLFNELKLEVGDTKSYIFETVLPDTLPPSHRGKVSKFVYKLTVLVKQKNGNQVEAQEIKIPIKIFNKVTEQGDYIPCDTGKPIMGQRHQCMVYCEEEHQQLVTFKLIKLSKFIAKFHEAGTRSDLSKSSVDPSLSYNNFDSLDIPPLEDYLPAYNHLETLFNINHQVQQAQTLYFNIKKEDQLIGRCMINKGVFRLGDTMTLLIDLQGAQISCHHLSATIEQSEFVVQKYANKSEETIESISRKIVSEHHENCLCLQQLPIQLAIPANSTPGFSTSSILLKWQLHIQFIVSLDSKESPFNQIGEVPGQNFYRVKPQVGVQTVDWLFPLKIFASSSENCASSPLQKSMNL